MLNHYMVFHGFFLGLIYVLKRYAVYVALDTLDTLSSVLY